VTSRDEADALELAATTYAHILAEAVQNLFPRHADHLRPVDRRRLLLRLRAEGPPVHRRGSAAIEAEMRKIIAADEPLIARSVERDED
jgi:threonyl-tRNA synthetase